MPSVQVIALNQDSNPRGLPFSHGLLRASGESIKGQRASDSFEVFVDNQGSLIVLLVDVRGGHDSGSKLLAGVMRDARAALSVHPSLYHVVSELEVQLAAQPGSEAGLLILRISQREAKVELLNAGMPAVASMGLGAGAEFYPALSGAVGTRVGEVHPYELLPLILGKTWLSVSDGMLNGALASEDTAALCLQLGLRERGLALSSATATELKRALEALLPKSRFRRDDATAVLVSAQPESERMSR